MNKTTIGIMLMVICTIFTALGQLFFKFGSSTIQLNIWSLITNYNLIIGFFFYGLGAILLVVALKFGPLSLLFPIVSLNFIWVTVISSVVFKEVINSFKINALILIIIGIFLIGGSESG
ncbi:multidrug transporter [Candidatus Woesearchaeota archaeon]|nr:multidrug transporter [Candidatus Woesearchaeota archaeon]